MMLKENQENILFLGSPHRLDEDNPLDFDERKNLLREIFSEKNLEIKEIVDNQSDEVWLKNIFHMLQKTFPREKNIIFYGGDFNNDSAYKAFQENKNIFSDYFIEYRENSREGSIVEKDGKKYALSGTNFRKFLEKKNTDIAQQFTDKKIFRSLE